jgi:argininosuccinate lyase
MRAAVTGGLMATDLADYLVRKRVTFRDAHGAVGRLVREAEEAGVELWDLPLAQFQAAHAAFGADILEELKPEKSLSHREIPGGTGLEAVKAQLKAARASIGS